MNRAASQLEAAILALIVVMVLWVVGSCVADHQARRHYPVDFAAAGR